MQKMDIVIAWVDGSDPVWQRRRAQYAGESETAAAAEATRFASNHEIYFCIASILKYVPFCGTIFVVTFELAGTGISDLVTDSGNTKDTTCRFGSMVSCKTGAVIAICFEPKFWPEM